MELYRLSFVDSMLDQDGDAAPLDFEEVWLRQKVQ
jgi:hypothetical protein